MANGERKAKIGVGIVTYQRPEYFKVARDSVLEHLGFVDEIVSYHDGPLPKVYLPVTRAGEKNQGVAHAKNWLLKELIRRDCDFLFLMEDDMQITDRKAIVGYLAACKLTAAPHLNFHGHGDNLFLNPLAYDLPLVYWPCAVGAWSFYTREVIEQVGYMDENFHNAYEHIEHSWRIYKGHLDYGWWPDVDGSRQWIRAQDGALKNSSIRDKDGQWVERIKQGLAYWRSIDPECPAAEPNWEYVK